MIMVQMKKVFSLGFLTREEHSKNTIKREKYCPSTL